MTLNISYWTWHKQTFKIIKTNKKQKFSLSLIFWLIFDHILNHFYKYFYYRYPTFCERISYFTRRCSEHNHITFIKFEWLFNLPSIFHSSRLRKIIYKWEFSTLLELLPIIHIRVWCKTHQSISLRINGYSYSRIIDYHGNILFHRKISVSLKTVFHC